MGRFWVNRSDSCAVVLGNAHAVEAAIHEHEGHREEEQADAGFEILIGHRDRDLDGEEAEEGGELDHGIHGDRRSVFERIAYGVTDHRGRV